MDSPISPTEESAEAGQASQLDPDSLQLQTTIDRAVRDIAVDDRDYVRRWRQVLSWAYNRTQGDPNKKKKLKQQLVLERGSQCEACGRELERPELQMHRVNQSFADDRIHNFGYTADNVRLLCVICHRQEEARRAAEADNPPDLTATD